MSYYKNNAKMLKISVIGAGHRAYAMFGQGITKYFEGRVKIVGVCDKNIKRSEYFKSALKSDMQVFTDFDEMLDNTKPDYVLVTTVDGFHHEYIIRAMQKGYSVLSEKPITVDYEKGMAIRAAQRKTGRKILVTFNCRYMPPLVKLKELVMSGAIGKPLSMNYEYHLNKLHGGDYFKRWHRFMQCSGGMLVHKSTHHFDIANWIIADEPASVMAHGNRIFYGLDDRPHGERCCICKYTGECPSYTALHEDETMQNMYFNAESDDGYIRDHCVFKPDTDIYDNMSVSVRYSGGALLTYSLNMFSSYEGYKITVTGDKGRLEVAEEYTAEGAKQPCHIVKLISDGNIKQVFEVPKSAGGHDGADEKLLEMLLESSIEDSLNQSANSYEGLKSAMIGICANMSIKENKAIDISAHLERLK